MQRHAAPCCLLPASRLLPAHCMSPALCCLLLAFGYILPAACCLLLATCCLLPAACFWLHLACCLLPAVAACLLCNFLSCAWEVLVQWPLHAAVLYAPGVGSGDSRCLVQRCAHHDICANPSPNLQKLSIKKSFFDRFSSYRCTSMKGFLFVRQLHRTTMSTGG